MNKEICCIFNRAPHYRASIFKLLDEELNCDFYFGTYADGKLKEMDYEQLKGYKKHLQIKKIPNSGFEWQMGVWKLVFKKYKHFIITGTPGSLSNWLLVILARILGKKVYAWTHGMKGNSSSASKFIQIHFYRLCFKILLYGDFSKNIMLKNGFNDNKLIPIYNSLDYKEHLRLRKTLKPSEIYKDYFKNNEPVLVYIGRIQKSKRLDLLIQAQRQLIEKNNPCNLIIIGEDIEKNEIPNLVKKYGLENRVWFYGACYKEAEIGNLIYNANLCVSPGLIGLTAIHSLSYGTPVITSDEFSNHGPEFEAIKPGVTGDFFISESIEDLCGHITNWIGFDSKDREKIRLMAYNTIDEKYNPNYQIDMFKKLFLL